MEGARTIVANPPHCIILLQVGHKISCDVIPNSIHIASQFSKSDLYLVLIQCQTNLLVNVKHIMWCGEQGMGTNLHNHQMGKGWFTKFESVMIGMAAKKNDMYHQTCTLTSSINADHTHYIWWIWNSHCLPDPTCQHGWKSYTHASNKR